MKKMTSFTIRLLLLGCLTAVVCSQTVDQFPCGLTYCSISRKQYCKERDGTCDNCEREMSRCGTSEMVNMRNTCLIYCYRDLMDKKREEQFQQQIQDINRTWTRREEVLQQQVKDLQQENEALLANNAELHNQVLGLSVGLGVLGVTGILILIFAVKKGYVCGSGKSGKGDLTSPTEEEALTVVTADKQDVDAKLSAETEDKASSGRGSAESSVAGSTEMLEDRESQPLLGAGLDQEGSPPLEARGRSGPPRAGSAPATPASMETPVKGGRNKPNNGQGFPDLARGSDLAHGDNSSEEADAPVSLASHRAPSPASSAAPASSATPAEDARAIATPRCRNCQQDVMCLTCARAQSLSDESTSMQPSSAHHNPNCPLAEDVYRKINSIRDTAPHSSAFTPS